jgi:riboflavin synthase
MFTGLVESPRPVVSASRRADGGLDLDVDLGALADDVALGDSIAVSGVCLTAARLENGVARFEVSPESLARTRLGSLRAGDAVNVERALAASARLGGHFVQGHVDGLGTVARLEVKGEWAELDVKLPRTLGRYCVEKGSIALDGVSLTIARLEDDAGATTVTIALVPLTLSKTTLGARRAGDPIHVEVDLVAKYVERLAEPHRGRA